MKIKLYENKRLNEAPVGNYDYFSSVKESSTFNVNALIHIKRVLERDYLNKISSNSTESALSGAKNAVEYIKTEFEDDLQNKIPLYRQQNNKKELSILHDGYIDLCNDVYKQFSYMTTPNVELKSEKVHIIFFDDLIIELDFNVEKILRDEAEYRLLSGSLPQGVKLNVNAWQLMDDCVLPVIKDFVKSRSLSVFSVLDDNDIDRLAYALLKNRKYSHYFSFIPLDDLINQIDKETTNYTIKEAVLSAQDKLELKNLLNATGDSDTIQTFLDKKINPEAYRESYQNSDDEIPEYENMYQDDNLKNDKQFKLRFYKLSGAGKGNLDHEEFFDTKFDADNRYHDVFKYELYSLNPTMWERQNGTDWKRIAGY